MQVICFNSPRGRSDTWCGLRSMKTPMRGFLKRVIMTKQRGISSRNPLHYQSTNRRTDKCKRPLAVSFLSRSSTERATALPARSSRHGQPACSRFGSSSAPICSTCPINPCNQTNSHSTEGLRNSQLGHHGGADAFDIFQCHLHGCGDIHAGHPADGADQDGEFGSIEAGDESKRLCAVVFQGGPSIPAAAAPVCVFVATRACSLGQHWKGLNQG